MALVTDLIKLESDVAAILPQLEVVAADVQAIVADIASGKLAAAPAEAHLKAVGTRLQNLICLAVPTYDALAPLMGWPIIPVPAWCSAPTPVPTPTT